MGWSAAPLIRAVLCLFAVATPAYSQSQGGDLSVTVTERSGGVVPEARVEAVGPGPILMARTGSDGRYRFPQLPPGDYRLTVSKPGFRPTEYAGIVIRTGEAISLTVVLDLDGFGESVSVTASRRPAASRVSLTLDELNRVPASPDVSSKLSTMPGVVIAPIDVGGNESHQSPQVVFRGSRMVDTAWTIDGVVVTDRQGGAPPGFYDTSTFAEIQFTPSSDDLTTGGTGLAVNMVVRSGTNDLHGTFRGTIAHDRVQASNLRDDLRRGPYFLTSDTADHTEQIADTSADLGGPLLRDRTWFFASASRRDVRIFRQASGPERAVVTPRTVKVNWQVTSSDSLNWLWLYHGVDRIGLNPSALRAPASALQDESALFTDNPFPGLWKVEARRTLSPGLSATARYSYYNTGFEALSRGSGQAGISPRLGETVGATSSTWSRRPQHTVAIDSSLFVRLFGRHHQVKFGGGWQRQDMFNRTVWPGDGVVAFDNSTFDRRARIHREAAGRHRLQFANVYLGDTVTAGLLSVDLGVRVDHQRAEALPGAVASNPAFPVLVPGFEFAGERHPSTLDPSVRAAATYALGASRRTVLRGSVGRHASQIVMGHVAQTNPAGVAGWIEYGWEDSNRDLLAQPNEVRTDLPFMAFAGVDPNNPSKPIAPAMLGPDVKSRIMLAATIGLEREFGASTTASIGYHYSRHTRWPAQTWRGLSAGDYPLVGTLTQRLPDGSFVSVPLHAPDPQKVLANGSQRMFVTDPFHYTTYHGLEASVFRRMSGGWMLGATAALNDSRAFYGDATPSGGPGNPTRLDGGGAQLTGPSEPNVEGGRVAPATVPGAGGQVFLNVRWQATIFGAFTLPWQLEIAGNLVGHQGTPSPYFVPQSLGLDGNRRILMTADIDSVRLDDVWNLDLRIQKRLRLRGATMQVLADVFNVMNGNSALMRDRNLRSRTFDRVTMNVSPRILRAGLQLSF